jgi:hypothetical protein
MKNWTLFMSFCLFIASCGDKAKVVTNTENNGENTTTKPTDISKEVVKQTNKQ